MERIVVDLGCATWHSGGNEQNSIDDLHEEYAPDLFFGFDPHLDEEKIEPGEAGSGAIILSRAVAWIHNGMVGFVDDDVRSATVSNERATRMLPCFDFSGWLRALPQCELIVKMDIEGAEYPLLTKMHIDGTDALVSELLIEWHTDTWANGHGPREMPTLRCGEIKEWW